MSALWTPSPNVAVADGQDIMLYAIAFGLGLWMATLLGRRAGLSLAPLAVAGAVAGLITAIGMITSSDPASFLAEDGTLEHPIGYRNANAAFFLVAAFRRWGWRSTATAIGESAAPRSGSRRCARASRSFHKAAARYRPPSLP